MIYTGKAVPSIMNEPINQSVIDFFKNYKPLKMNMPLDKEERSKIKKMKLEGFISGEMKALVRNNVNLISRDCLIIDLDDVQVSEETLVEDIKYQFRAFQYVLYPSPSHGIEGVRYRLVLPLDEPINEPEHKLLINFISKKVLSNILKSVDESNTTWSQIMFLPVITQFSDENMIVISDEEKKLPSMALLDGANAWEKENRPQKKAYTPKKGRNRGRYTSETTELFESLVIGCDEGNRDNRITQITGGLLARNVDVKYAYELVLFANEHFNPPYPLAELNRAFNSIVRKEFGAN